LHVMPQQVKHKKHTFARVSEDPAWAQTGRRSFFWT